MTHDDHTNVSSNVTDVFAHRFVVATATGRVLAELGTRGAEKVKLLVGDHVDLWGEMKPSELKVSRIAQSEGRPSRSDTAGRPTIARTFTRRPPSARWRPTASPSSASRAGSPSTSRSSAEARAASSSSCTSS